MCSVGLRCLVLCCPMWRSVDVQCFAVYFVMLVCVFQRKGFLFMRRLIVLGGVCMRKIFECFNNLRQSGALRGFLFMSLVVVFVGFIVLTHPPGLGAAAQPMGGQPYLLIITQNVSPPQWNITIATASTQVFEDKASCELAKEFVLADIKANVKAAGSVYLPKITCRALSR